MIPGQYTSAAGALLAADSDWVAPGLWRYELVNVLAKYCLRGLMTVDQALDAFTRASVVVTDVPIDPEPGRVLTLAAQSGCGGYDCVFVAVARMNSLRLVTYDQRVLAAFPDVAVRPEQVVSGTQP